VAIRIRDPGIATLVRRALAEVCTVPVLLVLLWFRAVDYAGYPFAVFLGTLFSVVTRRIQSHVVVTVAVVQLGVQRRQHGQPTGRRRSSETIEMDACVSVYSGQSDRLDRRRADVEALIDLDADVHSLDTFPVCTPPCIATTTSICSVDHRHSRRYCSDSVINR